MTMMVPIEGRHAESIGVQTSDTGEPRRIVWRSRPFRVTDTPTALVGTADWWRPFFPHTFSGGHLPLCIAGWRFQATSDDGETHVFDVRHAAEDDDWLLLRTFD